MAKCETCKHWKRHGNRHTSGHCSFWDDSFTSEDYSCDNHTQKAKAGGYLSEPEKLLARQELRTNTAAAERARRQLTQKERSE